MLPAFLRDRELGSRRTPFPVEIIKEDLDLAIPQRQVCNFDKNEATIRKYGWDLCNSCGKNWFMLAELKTDWQQRKKDRMAHLVKMAARRAQLLKRMQGASKKPTPQKPPRKKKGK